MALADDGDELLGADLVEFPVCLTVDGDGQGGDVEACLACLGGGIEGGCVGNDADYGEDLAFSTFFGFCLPFYPDGPPSVNAKTVESPIFPPLPPGECVSSGENPSSVFLRKTNFRLTKPLLLRIMEQTVEEE